MPTPQPGQTIPAPKPDVIRPPTPSEEPQPDKGPDLPQPGPDVVIPPDPEVITPPQPQEIPPDRPADRAGSQTWIVERGDRRLSGLGHEHIGRTIVRTGGARHRCARWDSRDKIAYAGVQSFAHETAPLSVPDELHRPVEFVCNQPDDLVLETIAGGIGIGQIVRIGALQAPPGFTGRAPGGRSRWSAERSGEWEPLRPELVVEVRYDHVTGDRFRHGTRLLRFRPDKPARQCLIDQITAPPRVPSRGG